MGPTPLIHLYAEAANSSSESVRLSFELGRLLTFKQWPQWAQVDPTSLAQAGFYYTGQRDQVKCFSCEQVFQDFTSDIVPLVLHKSRSPLCRFLQNEPDPIKKFCSCEQLSSDSSHVVEFLQQASLSNDIGKMQVTSESTNGRRRTPQEEADLRTTMHDLVNRLSSFKGWPETAPVYGPDLAEGGFFFLGERDRVCCAFCGKVLHSWDPGDNVMEEHKKASPNCPYILDKEQEMAGAPQVASNITPTAPAQPPISLPVFPAQPTGHLPRAQATEQIGIASLPAQPSSAPPQHIITPPPQNNQYGGGYRNPVGLVMNNPHTPAMAIEVNRLSTFRGNWPASQSPNIMAKAGFYYIGVRDHVKCFFCDVGLQNWNPNEDPWVEHARWKPSCGFLQQTRGQEFIQEVTRNYANTARTAALPATPPRARSPTPPTAAATQYNVQPREVKARMDTAMVRNMIEMGFDRRLIHHVIETKLRNSGEDFQNSNALLDALLTARSTWREPVSTSGESASTTSNMSGEIPTSTSYTAPAAAEPQSSSSQSTTSPTNTTEMEVETQSGDSKKRKKKKKSKSKSSGNEEPQPSTSEEGKQDNDEEAMEEEDPQSLLEENTRLKESRTCKVCMDEEVNIVFVPCGHLVCCATCAPALRICPICRRNINATIRTYIS